MRVMLTSCGLETKKIEEAFLEFLGKAPEQAKALFIPTAAIDADAIEVLPKNMSVDELETYDVIYLTGGRTSYLLERINDTGFRDTLLTYIRDGGFVIGVSAGSIIFANNLPGNLALLDTKLDVHCDASSYTGKIPADRKYEAFKYSGHAHSEHTR